MIKAVDKSKYKAKKVIINNIQFDSKKEAARYGQLLAMQAMGEIDNLTLQHKFELIPKGDGIMRPTHYIADFSYTGSSGELVVEDVKGYKGGQAYALFKLKLKLMQFVHKIRVIEI